MPSTHLNGLRSVDELCVLLCQTDRSVLERREDGRGHVDVVAVPLASPKEPAGQKFAGLDGNGRELQLALQDITDGVDVGHVGLLVDCRDVAPG